MTICEPVEAHLKEGITRSIPPAKNIPQVDANAQTCGMIHAITD
jgi:hypothetical protein